MNNCIIINGQKIELAPEQIEKAVEALSLSRVKLSDIPVGETFRIGANEFIVLDHYPGAAAVILKDLLPDDVTFGKNNRYDGSNPDQMCCEFAEDLFAAIGSENVIPHSVDLTSDDGLKDYGRVDRAVSLLTTEEYRRYVEILDKFMPDRWWWLATPYSTATHGNDSWVKCVSPFGRIGYDHYLNDYGVRPFCILKSDIFVSR